MIAATINRLAGVRVGSYDPSSDFWYNPVGYSSATGITVTPDTSLTVSTAFACIRVLADTVGAMPWQIFRDIGEDKTEKATGHELYYTIHDRPNKFQTPIDFKSLAVVHLQLRGNFYGRLDPPGGTWPWWQIVPLHPDRVRVEQRGDGELTYSYQPMDGPRREYRADRVLHVKLMTQDGVTGMTGATYAREVLGLTLAQLQHAASMFGNGGFFKYYLTTKKKLSEQGIKNFRAGWRNIHGKGGLFEPPILEDDMDIKTLGMSLEDTQWLESRQWNAVEICQFFGVPPHLVFADNDSQANMEQKGIEWLTIHLNPLLVRFEEALQPFVTTGYFSRFNRDAIARATLAERYAAHAVALGGRAWKTVDEVRALEDLPPLGGDAGELPPPPNASIPAENAGQKFNQRAADEEPEEDEDEPEVARPAGVDLGPIIADVAERIVTREAKVARWYGTHSEFIERAVMPVVNAHGRNGWDVEAWADAYCLGAINALAGQRVGDVLESWQRTKAAELAAEIKECLSCTSVS